VLVRSFGKKRFSKCLAGVLIKNLKGFALGNSAILHDTEILMPFAVLLAFVTSKEHADSFSARKQLCNRQGLHHARFESILGNEEISNPSALLRTGYFN